LVKNCIRAIFYHEFSAKTHLLLYLNKRRAIHGAACFTSIWTRGTPESPFKMASLPFFLAGKLRLLLAVLREPLEPGAMCYIKWQVFFWDAFVLHKKVPQNCETCSAKTTYFW